mgnify:CR=1 FL=1
MYERILRRRPHDPDALNFLGMLEYQRIVTRKNQEYFEKGLYDIRNFMTDYTDEDEDFEDCPEISTLQSLQHKIVRMRPKSEEDRINEELADSTA